MTYSWEWIRWRSVRHHNHNLLLFLLLMVIKLLTISVIFVSLKFQPLALGRDLVTPGHFWHIQAISRKLRSVFQACAQKPPGKDVINRSNCKSQFQRRRRSVVTYNSILTVEMTHWNQSTPSKDFYWVPLPVPVSITDWLKERQKVVLIACLSFFILNLLQKSPDVTTTIS